MNLGLLPTSPALPPFDLSACVFDSPHCAVWTAEGPNGPLAVKIPRTAESRRCLQAEAALLSAVDDPGLARLLDACPHGGWMATQWVDGPHADRWASGRSPRAVVELVACIAEAVASLHDCGLAHGDLKPANVLVTAADRPVVIDPAAGSAEFYGTPGYASPELLRGDPATAASDAYALGVTLFRLLTGGLPFSSAPTAQALVPSSRLPWLPGMVRPGVPAAVDALVLRLVHRDPDQRPTDLRAVARALRGAVRQEPRVLHPAVFAAWREVGGWLVEAHDHRRGGILVLTGGAGRPQAQLLDCLAQAAEADGRACCDAPKPTPGSVWWAPADTTRLDAIDAWRDHGCAVVLRLDRPNRRLADAGAHHLALVPEAPPQSPVERSRLAKDAMGREILDALSGGPRPVSELAGALGHGTLDLLDRVEPLLTAGLVEERSGGAVLALPNAPAGAPA